MPLKAGQQLGELPGAFAEGFGARELSGVVCERREERSMAFGLTVAQEHVNVMQAERRF